MEKSKYPAWLGWWVTSMSLAIIKLSLLLLNFQPSNSLMVYVLISEAPTIVLMG